MSRNLFNLPGYLDKSERQIKNVADEIIETNKTFYSLRLENPEPRDTAVLRPPIGDERMLTLYLQCTSSVRGPIDNKLAGASAADIELKLIDWFLACFLGPRMMNLAKDFTGHVIPGDSECNSSALHFSLLGLPDAHLFYSDQSHHSIGKEASIVCLLLRAVHEVESSSDGCIDLKKLKLNLDDAKAKGVRNVVVFLTLGTTVVGANDDIPAASKAIRDAGFVSENRKVIVNAALHSPPFALDGNIEDRHRPWFSHGIDFVWFSLNKLLSTLSLRGFLFNNKSLLSTAKEADRVGYIDAYDTMISGARRGHTKTQSFLSVSNPWYKSLGNVAD